MIVTIFSLGLLCGNVAAAEPSSKIDDPSIGTMSNRTVNNEDMYFKPGKGLVISSQDGEFEMITRLRAQFRYTLQSEDTLTHGLQLRRARLLFQGHVFGEHNQYKFELAVAPKDIGLSDNGTISKSPLLDWYFNLSHYRDLTVRMGQYKVPYSRQRVVSSGNLQFVDRSLANGEFTLDRDIGMDFRSKDLFGLDRLRYYAGIYMGEGHSSYSEGDLGMMYLGRIEYLPFGLFKDYSEVGFNRPTVPQLSIGAAYGYVDEAKRNKGIVGAVPTDGGTTDTTNLTADVCFRLHGFSIESAVFWREGIRNAGNAVDEFDNALPIEEARNGMGYYVQSGVLLPTSNNEMTLRYGQVLPSKNNSSLSEQSEFGVGFNHYIAEHAYKLQSDIFQTWSDTPLLEGDTQVRVQLQMAY